MYYAPTPAALVDSDDRIVDFNLAFSILLGEGVAPCRGESLAALETRLTERSAGGLFPSRRPATKDAATEVAAHTSPYRSVAYGRLQLRCTDVTHLDPDTGCAGRRTLYWEVFDRSNAEHFHERVDTAREHQLVWESYAHSYDRVLPVLPYYQEAVARHVAAMSPPGVHRILDVGAGTGNVTVELCGARREVTAIDLSRAMLERLEYKLPPGADSTVTTLEHNAENLSIWRDGTFDGVTILLALYDMGSPLRALEESLRVLRPGGRIVVTEPRKHFRLQELLAYVERFLRETGSYEELRGDFERVHAANDRLDPSRRSERLWAEDIAALLESADFQQLEIQDSHLGNCATIRATKPGGRR